MHAAVGEIDVRHGRSRTRMWTSGMICWTCESSAVWSVEDGKRRQVAVDGIDGRGRRVGDLDEVEADLAGVGEVLDRERRVLPGDLRGRGRLVGVRDVVGERFPRALQALPEGDQRRAVAHAEVLAAEGELARAEADREPLLGFGVQLAELVHDDRALLGEAIAEIAGQRERQARVDERGNRDAADRVGHGLGLRDFYEFDLRHVRAQHAGGLRPVAAEHDRVPALRSSSPVASYGPSARL